MYIKIRYGGWPNISDINKIALFFLYIKNINVYFYLKTNKQNKTKQNESEIKTN